MVKENYTVWEPFTGSLRLKERTDGMRNVYWPNKQAKQASQTR